MLKRLLPALALLPILGQAQDLKVEKYTLPNGMTVILHEDHSLPMAAVNVWYKVGSKDEPERRSGFAHLFEHLMFMGTERVPNGEFDTLMEKYGGSNNATTAEDRTNYFEAGPSSLLPTLLWLEADRLEDLGRMMDQKKLDLQREVVKNERRQTTENVPYGKAYEAIPHLMFPKGHPYSTSVIGSMEDLDNASVKDVKDFFATFYVPNNASMVIAGDFDSKTIKPLIAKLFGSLPKGNDIVRKSVVPFSFSTKRTTMVDDVQVPKTIMVWHSPAAYKPGDIEMRLAGSILSDGYSSRLYQSLVVDKGLASDVSAYQSSLLLGSLFYVEATAREGVPIAKLEAAIDNTLAEFRKKGPTKSEVDRQIAGTLFQSVNRLQSIDALADQLNEFNFYFGDPNSFTREVNLYKSMTPAKIQTAVAKTLDPQKRLVLRVVPQIAKPEVNPRNTKPEMAADKPFNFPKPTQLKLSNGIPIYYWRRAETPMVTATIRFDAGAAVDSPAKSGLAYLTADMLDEGAGTRNAEQLTTALESLGAQLSTDADQISSSVSLTATTDNFAKALPLMADVVRQPQLNKDEWDRVKSIQIDDLKQSADNPNSVAGRVGNREFFGSSHPYGRPTGGEISTVSNLKLDDVKAEYKRIFRPEQAAIFAAGNLSPEAFKALMEKQFGGWKSADKAMIAKPMYAAVNPEKTRVVVVDKPGAVQTVIRIYMPTEPFTSPNRPALAETGIVLGGTFTSRINRNLREDKGYTYGANLRFNFSRNVSYVIAGSSVRTDVTGASLKEFLKEFEKIRTGDITDDEASKARSTYRFDAVSGIGSIQSLVGTGIGYYEDGIPFNAVDAELAKFAALKASDLNAVVKNGLPVERALIVLVGDKGEILRQITDLGLPEPEIVKP